MASNSQPVRQDRRERFDRFARSASHLIRALDEFNHLGIRFVSVQDNIDTDSPMGKAMFTIIGAMAELESSLISERVQAGMQAAKEEGTHVGRPPTPDETIQEIERLAEETDLSIRKIKKALEETRNEDVSRGVVGRVVKEVRSEEQPRAYVGILHISRKYPMWLIEEYDVDITCVRIHAHEHIGEVLLSARQVIPIQEAEEYMTERRAKQEQQSSGQRRKRAVKVLLERGVLVPGDSVVLNEENLPISEHGGQLDVDFWKVKVTGKTGRSDNFKWLYDDREHSATGLAKTAVEELTGDRLGSLNGVQVPVSSRL